MLSGWPFSRSASNCAVASSDLQLRSGQPDIVAPADDAIDERAALLFHRQGPQHIEVQVDLRRAFE